MFIASLFTERTAILFGSVFFVSVSDKYCVTFNNVFIKYVNQIKHIQAMKTVCFSNFLLVCLGWW